MFKEVPPIEPSILVKYANDGMPYPINPMPTFITALSNNLLKREYFISGFM